MKITKQMIILWSVCMLAVIIISVSVMSLIMVSKKINYGVDINFDNLNYISYYNSYSNGNEMELSANGIFAPHKKAIEKILELLGESGKTNKFAQTFGQEGDKNREVISRTSHYTVNNVKSLSNGVYILIRFSTPQYCLAEENSFFSFQPALADSEGKDMVQCIYIPLGNAKDSFSEQTWYICTGKSTSDITHTFTTYGNYYELYKYVAELNLKS